MEHENNLTNEKIPKLSKEFGDVFRFWLAPIPMAAEAPELDLRPDDGVLPYREKSVLAGNLKFIFTNAITCTPLS